MGQKAHILMGLENKNYEIRPLCLFCMANVVNFNRYSENRNVLTLNFNVHSLIEHITLTVCVFLTNSSFHKKVPYMV